MTGWVVGAGQAMGLRYGRHALEPWAASWQEAGPGGVQAGTEQQTAAFLLPPPSLKSPSAVSWKLISVNKKMFSSYFPRELNSVQALTSSWV